MWLLFIVFVLGVIEDALTSLDVSAIANGRPLISALTTLVSVLIWYGIFRLYLTDISNMGLAVSYASGCALGSYLLVKMTHKRKKRKAIVRKIQKSVLEV